MTDDEKAPRPAAEVLSEQRKGGLADDMSRGLAELVQKVLQTGKQGTMTMKIKVKPTGEGVVSITDDLSFAFPREERAATIFFADHDGSLSRTDPRQTEIEMPIRTIHAIPQEAASA